MSCKQLGFSDDEQSTAKKHTLTSAPMPSVAELVGSAPMPHDQAAIWISEDQAAEHGHEPLQGEYAGCAHEFIPGASSVAI